MSPPFPGAVGVSHLRVYDTEAPDGLRGGTPHVHSVCTEAYAVVAGHGEVQTLSGQGCRDVPLEPGTFVWFTPGTIHRLVNHGDLEILVLMQNAGLPEAGDMVVTFPAAVLADEDAYRTLAVLPEDGRTTASSGEPAARRRDLAVEGFVDLRAAVQGGRREALESFYVAATRLLAGSAAGWRAVWEAGPAAATAATERQIESVRAGRHGHLLDSSVHALDPPGEPRRWGCCGTLGVYVDDRP